MGFSFFFLYVLGNVQHALGRNCKWQWIFVQEEKRSQSGEDSEESKEKSKKKLTKDPSAADAAREETVPHLN